MCSNHQPYVGVYAYEVNRIKLPAEQSVQLQQKTLLRWLNAKLVNPASHWSAVEDLILELRDGRLLMCLCVELCEASFKVPKQSFNTYQWVENVNRVIGFLQLQFNADLCSLAAEDVVAGRAKSTLRLVWCIVLAHHATVDSGAASVTNTLSPEKNVKSQLLNWCEKKCHNSHVKVNNFGSSWKNGLAFIALLAEHLGNADRQLLLQKVDTHNSICTLNLAFEFAEKAFHIPRLLDASDFNLPRHDEKSIITYLITFKQQVDKYANYCSSFC